MKKDILFEQNMLNLLKPLLEQEPGTAEPVAQPQAQQPGVAPTPAPIQPPAATPSELPPGQELVPSPRRELGAEIEFYSTKDLFTTAPSPNSSDWPAEIKAKPWMIPLQDGRVAQKLMKMFPSFAQDGRGHGAARYNDYQYRIILRGDLTAQAEIRAFASTKTPGTVNVELVSINIPLTGASNLDSGGTNKDSVNKMRNKGAINISMPTEKLLKWVTGREARVQAKKRVEDLMDQVYNNASEKFRKNYDRGHPSIKKIEKAVKDAIDKFELDDFEDKTVMKELFKKFRKIDADIEEPKIEVEPEAPAEEPEKKTITVDQHPSYRTFFDIATGESVGMKQKDAKEYLKWLIKTKKPPLKKMKAEDAATFVLQNLEAYKEREEQQESVNLSEYLKRLLLEQEKGGRQSKTELETKKGGELIATLNDQIFDQWFKKKGAGIAAPTNNRLFEGNMYEWFSASSATFTPKKRDSEGVGDEAVITFKGDLIMQSEIWIDARVGEGRAGFSSWSFRVWDKVNPITTSTFKIPITVKSIGSKFKRVKSARQEQASQQAQSGEQV